MAPLRSLLSPVLLLGAVSIIIYGCASEETGSSGAGTGTSGSEASSSGTGGAGGSTPSCSDGEKNGLETDTDCGGLECPSCAEGDDCASHTDCASNACEGGVCIAGSCSDGVANGDETDVDCGAGCPESCEVCKLCSGDGDCATGLCQRGLCAPTIEVVSATYAGNCGAPTEVPTIAAACNEKQSCAYLFNYTVDIGYDPAYGCYKDLVVEYRCSGGTTTKTFYEACAPCDPQNTPTMINIALDCDPCLGYGEPPG